MILHEHQILLIHPAQYPHHTDPSYKVAEYTSPSPCGPISQYGRPEEKQPECTAPVEYKLEPEHKP